MCVLRPAAAAPPSPAERPTGRIEELALPAAELSTSTMQRFLWACGIDPDEALSVMTATRETVRSGASGVLLRVETDSREPVEIRELDRASLSPAR